MAGEQRFGFLPTGRMAAASGLPESLVFQWGNKKSTGRAKPNAVDFWLLCQPSAMVQSFPDGNRIIGYR